VELEKAQTEVVTKLNERFFGQTVEVLVEDIVKGKWRGRNPQNRLVYFEDTADWTGRVARVQITRTGPWSLSGELEGTVKTSQAPAAAQHFIPLQLI
jgi:tRNA-2-methylthio-N6-dimethylallyladenosine synthase